MFRIITLLTCGIMACEANAVSVDQELTACASAWAALKNKDYGKAVKLADAKKCPLSKSFITWKWLRSDSSKAGFGDYANFIQKHADWPWMPVLMTKAEQAISPKTPQKDVLHWYSHRQPHTATGAIRYLGVLKDNKKATDIARKAWHSLDFNAQQQKDMLAKFGMLLRQGDHRARMEWLLNEQKLDQAKRLMPLLSGENVSWAKARLAYVENHPDAHRLGQQAPQTHDLKFEQLRWHRKNDDIGGARLLLSIPSQQTTAGHWWRERAFFAREALNQNNPQLSYELMASHPYSDGSEYADAEWFCGWVSLRYLNKPQQALQHFQKFEQKASLPKSKAKASFWMARAYEAMGDQDQAQEAYKRTAQHPATFYGMVVRRKQDTNLKLHYTKDPKIDPKQWSQFQNQEFVRMSRLLSKAGMGVEAEPFLYLLAKRTAKGSKAEKVMGLKVINEVFSPYTVFGSKDIRYQEADLFPWLYPRMSLDPKVKSQGVDTHLIHAIMRQESGFNPKVTSPAGAMGMMQLMPKTASVIAKKKGYRHHDGKLHSDPGYNILVGTHYFKEMLDQFQGSYLLAIAAYNCGPGPVHRWIERYGDPRTNQIDTIDFIESIPYSETREYVKSVLTNFYIYQALERK